MPTFAEYARHKKLFTKFQNRSISSNPSPPRGTRPPGVESTVPVGQTFMDYCNQQNLSVGYYSNEINNARPQATSSYQYNARRTASKKEQNDQSSSPGETNGSISQLSNQGISFAEYVRRKNATKHLEIGENLSIIPNNTCAITNGSIDKS